MTDANKEESTDHEVVENGNGVVDADPDTQPADNNDDNGDGGGSDDDDDDDSDDDIQITIDKEKIDEAKSSYQTMGLGKGRIVGGSVGVAAGAAGEKKGKFSVEDFDQPGTINGKEIIEIDLESAEEKPWKKPGPDLLLKVLAGKFKLFYV